ncbi:lytic transglycosylase domain-containing protein [Cyanobium sp. FGCU-6]|nr:lytic transglycosylase domain-containing protein [Cyanobium sp. FGCU6]
MARLPILLAVSCLGTGAALLLGRALLEARPLLTPATPTSSLERVRRWNPDPGRRREAALLLHAAGDGNRQARRALLRGQGWGPDPLAAVVLKLDALDAQALEQPVQAEGLWRSLLRRFPTAPASADALYALGRDQPPLRQQLLERWPAHPAALAAAVEAGPDPSQRLEGALHLARWGARWPGAEALLRQACASAGSAAPGGAAPTPDQRGVLAGGLAELGDGRGALSCLTPTGATAADTTALAPAARLSLARALLRGDDGQARQGEALLVELVRRSPSAPEAEEAVRLLAQQEGKPAVAALAALPPSWRDRAPVQARLALESGDGQRAAEVLQRWPDDPAAWDLQWELSRRLLLQERWQDAEQVLSRLDADRLAPALAARQRFWLGYVQQQLGQDEQATATWRELRLHHPGGYYGWRAAVKLGEGDLVLAPGPGEPKHGDAWEPLASGDPQLDRLWRLGQTTEAWEAWRQQRGSQAPRASRELLVEGRLRQGVGDDWTGLGQLEQAALRLPPDQCELLPRLERSLHPHRFLDAFTPVARQQGLPLALLLAVAKQESRFTPTVHSNAGAVGLLQLMPDTAAELAGERLSEAELETPERNAALGGRYLKGLLDQWKGNPLPAVASYNAGPGAVQGWVNPRLSTAPELWVEAIPFPETRLYVKKVLGNAWSYQEGRSPAC